MSAKSDVAAPFTAALLAQNLPVYFQQFGGAAVHLLQRNGKLVEDVSYLGRSALLAHYNIRYKLKIKYHSIY